MPAALPTPDPTLQPPHLHPDTLANAIPEVIYHLVEPGHPHQIQPQWFRKKASGRYQLQLTQPAAGPRFHPDGSLCIRPEVCPQGESGSALLYAVRWLTEKEDWILIKKIHSAREGLLECRLQPPNYPEYI